MVWYDVGRRRRTSTQRTVKSVSLGACSSHSVPRDYTSRDQADYTWPAAGRQSSSANISTMRRCGCPFHSQESFSSLNHASTVRDHYTPTQPLYAHASSTQLSFPPEVLSTADRKRLHEAAILSGDGGSFSVDGWIVGRDDTLDELRNHFQPDIVTRHAQTGFEMASR